MPGTISCSRSWSIRYASRVEAAAAGCSARIQSATAIAAARTPGAGESLPASMLNDSSVCTSRLRRSGGECADGVVRSAAVVFQERLEAGKIHRLAALLGVGEGAHEGSHIGHDDRVVVLVLPVHPLAATWGSVLVC